MQQVKIDKAPWRVVGLRPGAPSDSPVFLVERAEAEGASTGSLSGKYFWSGGGW